VFPSGTANLLFANIGNAPEPAALARACRVGHTACIDLGEISWEDEQGAQHVKGFGLMSGTGFDAQLMEAALPNKAAMGQAAYFAAAFANPRPTVEEFTIIVDGQEYHRRGISCMVADNAMIQGDIQIVPDCRMDDGLLDVIVIETQDAAQVLRPLFSGIVDKTGKSIGRPHLEPIPRPRDHGAHRGARAARDRWRRGELGRHRVPRQGASRRRAALWSTA
jgi:diacylglycerol kinase family enzyme